MIVNFQFIHLCFFVFAILAPLSANAEQINGCACGTKEIHWGDDWTAKPGTPVSVAQDGVVIKIEKETGAAPDKDAGAECGQYVVVKHYYPNGKVVFTRYAQLGLIESANGSQLNVGQAVKQGESIGKVGETGFFHFEVRPVPAGNANTTDDWLNVMPVNPKQFDFKDASVVEETSFPWETYRLADIDAVYETDTKLEPGAGAGQKIWSPLRKLHFQVALLSYPENCNLQNLGYALSVSGVSLQSLPKISTCVRFKTPKGHELSVFIQDQVGTSLQQEIKIGDQVDLYTAYVYANEISKTLGMVISEFKKPKEAAAAGATMDKNTKPDSSELARQSANQGSNTQRKGQKDLTNCLELKTNAEIAACATKGTR